jgi:hypothetical protein
MISCHVTCECSLRAICLSEYFLFRRADGSSVWVHCTESPRFAFPMLFSVRQQHFRHHCNWGRPSPERWTR